MSSILTNNTALTALQSLRMTQQALYKTQSEISTGLAIGSAADNAATWSIAQTMTSDMGVISTLNSNLSQSSQQIGVALNGVNAAITVMNSIKAAITQAEQPGADLTAIGTSLQQLGSQLNTIVQSSSFNGANLLNGSQGASMNITASYNDGYDTQTSTASTVNSISLNLTALTNSTAPTGTGPYTGSTPTGTGILQNALATGSTDTTDFTQISSADLASTAVGTGATASTVVANTLSNADEVISKLTQYASTLGATQSRVDSQNTFLQTISTSLTSGIGALVDADMNQASTRLQALQTQQQLGIQSLSISNQNAQMILKLFQ